LDEKKQPYPEKQTWTEYMLLFNFYQPAE